VREQVQGDAHELFYWRLEDKGLSRARRAFIWDVVRLFKWQNIKRKNRQNQQLNHIAMFKNYFKIGLRNLWRQKMPSTINIIGLSLAVGCCLVSFLWIESKFFKDQFHENTDRIYLVTPTIKTEEGDNQRYGRTALSVADQMETGLPGISSLTRFQQAFGQIKVKGASFGNTYHYTDPAFFEVFTFPFVHGDATVLAEPGKVIISESNAEAFFGEEHPIGQQIMVEIDGEERPFEVAAVISNPPNESSLRPGLILSRELFERNKDRKTTKVHTFVLLNKGVKTDELDAAFARLAREQRSLTPDNPYEAISLEPLASMAKKNGTEIYNAMGGMPPMAPVILLSCIGVFMLLLSTFNYINIAVVMAMKRVKEIGVRKVIGSRRMQLVSQFLTENLILCTLAIVLGCLLASAFFLPWFNVIAGSDLRLNLLEHQNLWFFLTGLLLFITLASGAYPAFYISSFKPVTIFRGQSAKSSKRRLTGALLTFQMILAVITIVAGVMFVRTNQVNESRDWGYDQFDKLVVRVPPGQTVQTVSAEFRKNPNVLDITASRGVLGSNYRFDEVELGEKKIEANVLLTDYKYPEMMDLTLVEGSFFSPETVGQNQRSLVVNQQFMKELGIAFEDHTLLTIDSVNYMVTGVVEDYHYRSFSDLIRPAGFRILPDSVLTNLTVKVQAGTILTMKEELEAKLKALNPDHEPYIIAQDTVFDSHFEEARGVTNIMIFTATLSVLLAAMGLFGLVSLSISSRIKDFGIKKVLGASLAHLSKDVYKRFVIILGLAIVIGGSLSVFLIGSLLDSVYGYHEKVGVGPLSLAGCILLLIAAFTINTQIGNVKRMNPAETLRTE
jgi:ABC-type antimicrobial peptide transport system permease subunit